jgi:ribonuclease J
MVSIDEALKLNDKKYVIMCTGSQGEPSSIIGRLSAGTNRQFDVKPGDTIILSSHPIPGNEEAVNKTINRLIRRGADVIYEAIKPVHVSGHASSEEQKLLLNLVRPRYFIPIHGELHQLKQHAILAQQVGIPKENIIVAENGQVIEYTGKTLRLGERIPGGYIFVEGESVGEIDLEIMREREQLARSGIMLITISLDKYSNRMLKEPEIITRGFISPNNADQSISMIKKKVIDIINGGIDDEKVISDAVRGLLHNETRRKPLVYALITKA